MFGVCLMASLSVKVLVNYRNVSNLLAAVSRLNHLRWQLTADHNE